LADAGITLAALHIAVQTKTQPAPADQESKVLDQSILPGTTVVPNNTTVMLTVGDARKPVPPIVGHTWQEAAGMLALAHFSNITVEQRPEANVSPGFVAEVHPDVSTQIAGTDPLHVVVAAPPVIQTFPMPKVNGLPLEMASDIVRGAGLLFSTSGNVVPGAVVQSSTPAEGQPVQLGAKVNLAFPPPPGCVGRGCFVVNSTLWTNAINSKAQFLKGK